MSNKVTARFMQEHFLAPAGENKHEGLRNLYQFIKEGLAKGDIKAKDISIPDVAAAMGVLDPMDMEGSMKRLRRFMVRNDGRDVEELLSESHAATVTSGAFQAVTGDIMTAMVMDAYNTDGQYIGDQLVTVERTTQRRQRIATMRGLGDLLKVPENHPYEETGLGERWVQTDEAKYGRVISASMEALLFDRSGAIPRAMNDIGKRAREKREELILKGVQDTLPDSEKVWRPLGTPTTLYATGNYNLIGTGGAPTGYTSAIPLTSWQDLDKVQRFRALEVKDDRVDGTTQPIAGLNSPNNVLLIPWALTNAAFYATQYTGQENGDATGPRYTIPVNSGVQANVGPVLRNKYLDANSSSTWYYGDFKSQFLWTEIAPIATFSQGADSESAFDRDVNLRIKVRFYAGITALDSCLVTKVLGA